MQTGSVSPGAAVQNTLGFNIYSSPQIVNIRSSPNAPSRGMRRHSYILKGATSYKKRHLHDNGIATDRKVCPWFSFDRQLAIEVSNHVPGQRLYVVL